VRGTRVDIIKVMKTINIKKKGEEEESRASYPTKLRHQKVKEKSKKQKGKVDVLPKI